MVEKEYPGNRFGRRIYALCSIAAGPDPNHFAGPKIKLAKPLWFHFQTKTG